MLGDHPRSGLRRLATPNRNLVAITLPPKRSYTPSADTVRRFFPAAGGAVLLVEFPHFHKQRAADYWTCTGTYRIMCPQNAETSPPECRSILRKAPLLHRGKLISPQARPSAPRMPNPCRTIDGRALYRRLAPLECRGRVAHCIACAPRMPNRLSAALSLR